MSDFIETPASKNSLSNRKLVYGIGINDSRTAVSPKAQNNKRPVCPFYQKWKGMIERCYSVDSLIKNPTYKDCYVSSGWLLFSNFKNWMVNQDWEGKELDKDIKVVGNKAYGPDTCLFVSKRINRLLTDHRAKRGDYPQGVDFKKTENKYRAQCNHNGKRKTIGYFLTVSEASNAYLNYKRMVIMEESEKQENKNIKKFLVAQAKALGVTGKDL